MTLKELLKEINDGGWLVSNLYQVDYNSWRCNLRKAGRKEAVSEGFTSFDYGSTAFKALALAWDQAQDIDEKKVKQAAKRAYRYRIKS